MAYSWYHESLKFESDLKEIFSPDDLKYLSTKDILDEKERELYLQGSEIFIDDDKKIECSENIKDVYEYYNAKIKKLKTSNIDFFIFKEVKNLFERVQYYIKYKNIPQEYTENITVREINSNILDINPYFFNGMISVYKIHEKKYDNIKKLRNLQSAMILSDKISCDNNILNIYYHDPENENDKFTKSRIDFTNDNITSLYFYVFDWVGIESENREIIDLKYKVSKIYLSKFEGVSNDISIKKKEVQHDLNLMYNLVLQKKSKKYYEYNKLIRDHKIEIIQQKIQLKNELNKKLMSMMIFIPITIYGFYITIQKSEESLNIFNGDFNIIYISSFIALIFVILSLKNDVTSINRDYKEIISEIINTYKISEDKEKFGNNIGLMDFKFSLFWTVLMILVIAIIIFIINKNYITKLFILLKEIGNNIL